MSGRARDDSPGFQFITHAMSQIARAKVVDLDEWRSYHLVNEIYNLEPEVAPALVHGPYSAEEWVEDDDWDEDESA